MWYQVALCGELLWDCAVLGVIHVAAQCFGRFVLTSMDDPADLVAIS
jgi:hypothetical protein